MIRFHIQKKVKGVSTFVATLICMAVLMMFVTATIYSYSSVVRHNRIERIERQYMLKMEKEGYLTDADRISLLQDLEDANLINIDLAGTSMAPVGYGNTVTLRVSGDLEVSKVDFVNTRREQGVIHIEITKTGTALY